MISTRSSDDIRGELEVEFEVKVNESLGDVKVFFEVKLHETEVMSR